MRRIRRIAGFLFAGTLAVIGWASPVQVGAAVPKYNLSIKKPAVKESSRLNRDNDRQTLQTSLAGNGSVAREDLEKLQKKIRMRVADGYVRHISAPVSTYFPVEKNVFAPQVFQGPAFVQTAHRFIKTNQELICSPSNRVAFVTDKRRWIENRGFVRMQQMYDGLPVVGASVIVQTHGEDGVTAVFSDVLRDLSVLENGLVSTTPHITPERARKEAIRATSSDKYPAGGLVATEPVLSLYDPGVLGLKGNLELVWDITVTQRDVPYSLVQERVLVNAQDATIPLHFNEVRTSMYRTVYDNEDRTWPPPGGLYSYYWFNDDHASIYPRGKCRRWEEEIACLNRGNHQHLNWPDPNSYVATVIDPVPWCNVAFTYLADIYTFYRSQHQRDSYGPWPDPFGEGPGPIQDHGLHEIVHAPGVFAPPNVYIDPEPYGGVQGMPYGEGYEMKVTTRVGVDNAYFLMYEGEPYIVVGTRYQACDDVLAHEFTHGVTHFESNLFYMTESGAIDEALSDMWGEWIDLTNTPYGTTEHPETAYAPAADAVRWVIGEDTDIPYHLPDPYPTTYYWDVDADGRPDEWEQARAVAIRDMRNPPYYGQPDKTTSPYFWAQLGDNGGVHQNSGIINKLAYLLSDGDTFNNQVVLGMGITDDLTTYTYYTYPKPPTSSRTAPQLFYEVQCNLLTPTCDFEDLYYALLQACDNLGMSEAEKQNVDKACAAVEIKPARISEAYNIVYKDKRNPALKPLIDDETNEIIIADPQAYGTLKITKKKNFPKNRLYDTPHGATIRVIKSAGTLLNVYTEADVDDLNVDGELQSTTAKGCYVKRIQAGEVGTVRETDYARSWSTGDEPNPNIVGYPWYNFTTGEYYMTSIISNLAWTPGRLKSGSRPLSIQLNGVGTLQVYAPAQSATASISSKKWKVPVFRRNVDTDQLVLTGFADDISYAGTPTSSYGTAGVFTVGELKSYKLQGGSFGGSTFASLARTSVVTDIKTSSLASNMINGGYRYAIYYTSWFMPDLVDLGSDKVRFNNSGGWMAPEVAQVAGEISTINSRTKWFTLVRLTTETLTTTATITEWYTKSYGAGGAVGLYYSDGSPYDDISVFRSGMDPSSEFQNILRVQATNFVRGNFQAGTEFDSDGNALAIRGDIKSIVLGPRSLLDNTDLTSYPAITGHGWSNIRPKFKGEHSGFIIHDLPYVPTDPH